MYTKDSVTLVVQGPIYPEWTPKFIDEHQKSFNKVILSTWKDQDVSQIPLNKENVILNEYPPWPGKGHVNYQIVSSREGANRVETPYCIKIRSDMLMEEPEKWLAFFSGWEKPDQWPMLFTLGLSRIYPFSPRDQIFAGHTKNIQQLFDVQLREEWYNPSPPITEMYPELYLGLSYYAKHHRAGQQFLEYPNQYILGNAPEKHIAMNVWSIIGLLYMYPVSKHLKYKWPKRFGDGYYDYNNTAYGEFWHEDIQQDLRTI